MQASKSLGQALLDVFVSPAAAFAGLRQRTSWAWAALGILIVCNAIGVYAFMGPMSPEWIVEQQLAQADLPPTQVDAARANLLKVAPYTAHLGAIMGGISMLFIGALIGLVYFVGERALTKGRNGYGGWFAVALWSALPMAVNALGLALISLLASDPNQPLNMANYASLNSLVLGLPVGHAAFTWASSISLFQVWSIALAAVAFRVWSEAGWGKAVLLAAVPFLLVFGVWGLFV